MEDKLKQFLATHFDTDFVSGLEFSAVPRGQAGDLAVKFFGLAKVLGKSPVEIAKEVQTLLENCELLEKTEIAGPYLNLYFKSADFFENVLSAALESKFLLNKKIVLEFSGPNTNKPLHLGHMRNHALGISLSNLLEANGAQVHRVNIINDRGVHICKSMLAYQKFGNGETPADTGEKPDSFVGRYYVLFNTKSKEDPSLKDEVQSMLVKWEAGDEAVRALWQKMNGWTLSGHAETYKRQGVVFEKDYKESDYYQNGKDIAEKGLSDGVFETREDGTVFVDLEDEGLDKKVVLRADKTSIYLTQDLAVAVARKKDYDPSELIYVVGNEQNYHFKVLFLCLEKLGLINARKCFHLSYGMVNLPDGRMKSREGTVVDADPTMDELKRLALAEINKRNPDLDKEQAEKTAEQIQNAAWKFFLLSTSPIKAILFDKDKSIQFEGATGPYLQYAGVRMKSIFRKANFDPTKTNTDLVGLLGEAEKPLGVKVLAFENTLIRAAETKNPTYIVTFLLELAQDWSSYYANNSVLKAETEELKNARLALAHKVYQVLERGLAILGIEIPEQM